MRRMSLFLCALSLLILPLSIFATCGGGGGGGKGGIPGGGGPGGGEPQVYHVPWTLLQPGDTNLPDTGLSLLWFPAAPEEVEGSDLRTDRRLYTHSGNCVNMIIVPPNHVEYVGSYGTKEVQPVLILVDGSRQEISRSSGEVNGMAGAALVQAELDKREAELKDKLKTAKSLAKAGDDEAAKTHYQDVYNQHCLFPSLANKARKGLKKLGVTVDKVSLEGVLNPAVSEDLMAALGEGLRAEWSGDYEKARLLYTRARDLDPNDPVPLRYLGELYRHHTGEWDLALGVFARILDMEHADPMSRAVALHGTGKMTIHGGEFDKGLAMFEESIAIYPLALTYRNLAVYWNSEDMFGKAYDYVQKALALDPEDPYNQVFAATYLVGLGKKAEALEVAEKFRDDLPSSYNLAAIHALAGQPEEALRLLKRHFFEFEQYDEVRKREMWEAREDIVFATLHQRPEFIELTSLSR